MYISFGWSSEWQMLTLNCFLVSWFLRCWALKTLILGFALLLTCGADEDLFLPVHCPAELGSLAESGFYTGLDAVLGNRKWQLTSGRCALHVNSPSWRSASHKKAFLPSINCSWYFWSLILKKGFDSQTLNGSCWVSTGSSFSLSPVRLFCCLSWQRGGCTRGICLHFGHDERRYLHTLPCSLVGC